MDTVIAAAVPPVQRTAAREVSPESMSLVSEGAGLTGSAAATRAEPNIARVADYFALMKPRVMSLVVFTALVGLVLAPVHLHPVIAFTALICIAVGAGAA